jgi:hypothetical protein
MVLTVGIANDNALVNFIRHLEQDDSMLCPNRTF